MAEFHGIFAVFSAISVANRGSGWNGQWGGAGRSEVGGVGSGKNPCSGYLISSHDAHTVDSDTPVGHIVSGSKSSTPLPIWHSPWVPLY